jgi:glucose dehydrogenase
MIYRKALTLAGALAVAAIGASGSALANAEVEKRAANPNEWGAPGRDNKLTRHSDLKDINTGNVN